jgi:type II secretory pathway component PulM
MKDWFYGLDQRERMLVSVGGTLLVLLFLYTIIWEPIAG